MSRKSQIDPKTKDDIDELLAQSAEKFKQGDLKGSLEIGIRAWNLIPEPKNKWDYYPQSLSRGFVEDFTELGDKENVQKWIAIMADMYDDPNHEDHLVLMTEGEAMYKLGDLDRAYYMFDRIHEIYGRKGFAGDQLEYLEFYLKERAARQK